MDVISGLVVCSVVVAAVVVGDADVVIFGAVVRNITEFPVL